MKNIRLSVVLATRNEEENIGLCLASVKSIANEIIVVDEESNDKTVKIAKSFGARVITVPHSENFHITKNIAINSARGDWVLQLDADEIVSPELAQEIQQATSSKQTAINGYWMNRRNWFLSRFLTKGGQYPDPTLRLYRNGKGILPATDVHEQAKVEGSVGHLTNDLLHYRDRSFGKYLSGFDRYSTFISAQLSEQQLKVNFQNSFLYLFIKPFVTFIKIYIRHKGFIDGFPGFIFAFFSGLIHPIAFIKYWHHTK